MQLADALGKARERYARLDMVPLRVTALLVSPLIQVDPLHLDAILATALVERVANGTLAFGTTPDVIPLPLDKLGVVAGWPLWAVNSLHAESDAITSQNYLHKRALPSHLTKGSLHTGKGRHKEMRRPFPTLIAEQISADCLGNPEAIAELLSAVSAIGKKRAAGHGVVTEWLIEEIDHYSPFDNTGKPLRPLPHDLYPDAIPGNLGGWTTPYWYRPLHRTLVVRQ